MTGFAPAKKLLPQTTLLALLLGAVTPLHAEDGQTEATVLEPLSVVKVKDLDFGSILVGNRSGTIEVDPVDGSRNASSTLTLVGNGQAAQLLTYGGPRQFVWIRRGAYPVLKRVGGTETMSVDQLSLNGPVFRYISEEGLIDLRVGGRLRVNANQPAGTYVGEFEITVTYF